MEITEKINKIEQYIADNEEYHLYFSKSPFGSDLRVDYYDYPQDMQEATRGLVNFFLRNAGYGDLYSPLKELMDKAVISSPSVEEINNGCNCYFIAIRCSIYPAIRQDLREHGATESVNFICLPFLDEIGDKNFALLVSPRTGNIFEEMKRSKLLEKNASDDPYICAFEEVTTFVCARLGIDAFQGQEEGGSREDLEEFMSLVGIADKKDFVKRYDELAGHPDGLGELLQATLNVFCTDWKIDNRELKAYISSVIGGKFDLPNKILGPYEIVQRIEQESDYTLLDIEMGMDAYCFWMCRQVDSKRVLQLARILNFPIERL